MRKPPRRISNHLLQGVATVSMEASGRVIEQPIHLPVMEERDAPAQEVSGNRRSTVPYNKAVPRAPPAHLEPLSVTVKQGCALLNVGPTTLWKLIGTGKLKTVRIGRRRLVVFASLKALMGA